MLNIYKLKAVFINIYLKGPFFSSCLEALRPLSSALETGLSFLVPVECHDKDTLLAIIKNWILHGTNN